MSISVEPVIYTIRDQKVILDSDLARIYDVTTRRLNEQLKRNRHRFPSDFVFQLTSKEYSNLMSQFATSSLHGGRRKLPNVFTEHGAIMASMVLNSSRATQMSIYVVRAFVKMRKVLTEYKELEHRLDELEKKFESHDEQIQMLIDAIRQLLQPPEKPKRQM